MLGILQKIAPWNSALTICFCAIVCFEHCHVHQGCGDEPNKKQQTHIHFQRRLRWQFSPLFFHQISDKPPVKNHCKKTSGIDLWMDDVFFFVVTWWWKLTTHRVVPAGSREGGGWWTRILEPWLDRPGPKRCQNRRQPCQWWLLFFVHEKEKVEEWLAIEFLAIFLWGTQILYIVYIYISIYI